MLNLPISVTEKFKNSNNILIVGAGGGSDILCGLPLYYCATDWKNCKLF